MHTGGFSSERRGEEMSFISDAITSAQTASATRFRFGSSLTDRRHRAPVNPSTERYARTRRRFSPMQISAAETQSGTVV